MKANNLFAKPILKAIFFIAVTLGAVNLSILLTQVQPLPDLTHISIAVSFFLLAGLVMSKNFFVKYNSEDEVIEIERSGLFSSRNTVHSMQLGFIKTKVQGYSVEKTWYGGSFTLIYSTSSGRAYSKKFPMLFVSNEMLDAMDQDLEIITNSSILQAKVHTSYQPKILKNGPAFS
jgi:hypothetical protein